MTNQQIIEKFYTAFKSGNAEGMIDCYHDDIIFEDPAFGRLTGNEAKSMWHMLLSRNKDIDISYSDVHADHKTGSAIWKAAYIFTPTGRRVLNKISAEFEFEGNKIIKHKDHFNMWKWTRMALGWKGFVLGWTPMLKNKVREQAKKSLRTFMNKQRAQG